MVHHPIVIRYDFLHPLISSFFVFLNFCRKFVFLLFYYLFQFFISFYEVHPLLVYLRVYKFRDYLLAVLIVFFKEIKPLFTPIRQFDTGHFLRLRLPVVIIDVDFVEF